MQMISLAEAMCLGVHEQFLGLLFKPYKLYKQELLFEASYCCERQPLFGRITRTTSDYKADPRGRAV